MDNKTVTVLHIITKLELGGAQKVALALLNGINQTENHALLVSGTSGALVDQIKNNPNITLIDSMTREVSVKNFLWLEIKNFFKLIKIIRAHKKNNPHFIVHTHSTKAGLVGRWAAFFAGATKRVHTIHGYGFHDHQPRLIWTIIYLLELITSFITTHYICVSSRDVATGKRLFPRFAKKYSLIRAAIDEQQFFIPARKTTLNQTEQFIFGTVSSFTQKGKNIPELLRAFAYVVQYNPNARLEIIGDGIYRPLIERTIAKLNLTKVVTLHGWQQTVAPIMHTWNAFVMSSLWEGLPCAIVEARALKLPVLAYDTGGISDVIIHGKNGLLYKQKDWLSLARGMLELSKNPPLYHQLHTFNDDLSNFKYDAMVKQHLNLYTSL